MSSRNLRKWLATVCLALVSPSFAAELSRYHSVVRDLDGKEYSIGDNAHVKASVIVFINTDCPIANAYHPTINGLREQFGADFEFLLIHANTKVTAQAAQQHRQEYKIASPVAIDPDGKVQRLLSAKASPEVFVIGPRGELIYRGRIDDRYVAIGKKRALVSQHDLKDTLQAITDSRPVLVNKTEPIGCRIRIPTETANEKTSD